MTKVQEIEQKIQSLSAEEKRQLLRSLIAQIDGPADPDADQAWIEEATRRHREVMEGKVKTIPAKQVLKKVRARLKR
jgi:putative addiction module component (TIGR02574 family)